MPLVTDPSSWSHDRLLRQLRRSRNELGAVEATFRGYPRSPEGGWAVEIALPMLAAAGTLADEVLSLPDPPDPLLVGAVDLLYDTKNAMPYLARVALGKPKGTGEGPAP